MAAYDGDVDGRAALLLAFDCDSPDFARGFEAGRVWAALRAQPTGKVVEVVHATNAEMALRMADATNRCVKSLDVDETWLEVTFEPTKVDTDD